MGKVKSRTVIGSVLGLTVIFAMAVASFRWAVQFGIGTTWHTQPKTGWALTATSTKGRLALAFYQGSSPLIFDVWGGKHLLGTDQTPYHVRWSWAHLPTYGTYAPYTRRQFAGFLWFAQPVKAPGFPTFSTHALVIPYWFLTLLMLSPFSIAWRRHRRTKRLLRENICPDCGYDLRASPDRCPECGGQRVTTFSIQ
jgi:hypothetical protein